MAAGRGGAGGGGGGGGGSGGSASVFGVPCVRWSEVSYGLCTRTRHQAFYSCGEPYNVYPTEGPPRVRISCTAEVETDPLHVKMEWQHTHRNTAVAWNEQVCGEGQMHTHPAAFKVVSEGGIAEMKRHCRLICPIPAIVLTPLLDCILVQSALFSSACLAPPTTAPYITPPCCAVIPFHSA